MLTVKSRIKLVLKKIFMICAALFILFSLYTVGFGVPCFIKSFTGLSCPSCGVTRMSVQFMHGNIRRGFYYNQILPFVFPLMAIFSIRLILRYIKTGESTLSKNENYFLLLLIIILLIYGIVRNLPFYPYKI